MIYSLFLYNHIHENHALGLRLFCPNATPIQLEKFRNLDQMPKANLACRIEGKQTIARTSENLIESTIHSLQYLNVRRMMLDGWSFPCVITNILTYS